MDWDMPHHRGVGLTFEVLQPPGAYQVLSCLYRRPRLLRSEVVDAIDAQARAYAPLVGERHVVEGIRRLLGSLVELGLVDRRVPGSPGSYARYEVTPLGAGLVEVMAPVTDWAMTWFYALVLATRKRLKLPPLPGPILPAWRQRDEMTALAIGLFEPRWASPVMSYVDSAGERGAGPADLMERINRDLESLSGAEAIERRLVPETANSALRYLVGIGLLEKVPEPPRVWYRPTRCGRALLDARWEVSGWGIEHDAELFKIVSATSVWYRRSGSDG